MRARSSDLIHLMLALTLVGLSGCLPFVWVEREPLALTLRGPGGTQVPSEQALYIPVFETTTEVYILEEQDDDAQHYYLGEPRPLNGKVTDWSAACIAFIPGISVGTWTDRYGGILIVRGFKCICVNYQSPDELELTPVEPGDMQVYGAEVWAILQKKTLGREDLEKLNFSCIDRQPKKVSVRISKQGKEALRQLLVGRDR